MPSNPSAAGSLFTGLSTSIFDALHKQKVEQVEADKRKKGETLKYLTSLIDETTPDTRPILMRHIGDVMGLKGKHRGVWDMLTGRGDQAYSDALDEKLRGVMGDVVGPAEYEQLKPRAVVAEQQPDPMQTLLDPVASMVDGTAGKIALQDPNAARLALLKAQYDIQRASGLEKLAEQQRLIGERQALDREDRQAHALQMADVAAYNKAHGEVYKRAATIAQSSGKPWNDPTVLDQAAQDIATLQGLDLDKVRAQIGLAQAKSQEALANAAAAGSIDPATGLASGDPLAGMKPGERVRFDQAQQQAAQGVYNRWLAAKATVDKTFPQIQQLRSALAAAAQGMNASFDEEKGTLINNATGQPVNPYLLQGNGIDKKIAQLRALTAQAAQAETEVKGHSATLQSQYSPYYTVGADHWSVTPNAQFGGVGQTGAPRTGTQIPPFPQTSMSTNSVAPSGGPIQYNHLSSQRLPVGTVLPGKNGGQSYKIVKMLGKEGNYYRYETEPVK